MDKRFFEIAECKVSGLATTETLYATPTRPIDDGDMLLESYRCTYLPGKSIADSDAFISAWKTPFDRAVKYADTSSVVMRRGPLIVRSSSDGRSWRRPSVLYLTSTCLRIQSLVFTFSDTPANK